MRSTMITTSAASVETVAPAAPIATPTSASGERGRVVDAVADHHDGPQRRVALGRCNDARACRSGSCSAKTTVDADAVGRRPRRSRGRSPVTMRDVAASPAARRRSTAARGVGDAARSAMTTTPAGATVDADVHDRASGRAGSTRRAQPIPMPRRSERSAQPTATRAGRRRLPSMPCAGLLVRRRSGSSSSASRGLGVVHERLGEHVRRELIDRRREAQQLVGVGAVERDDRARPRASPSVSVPVLSSSTRARAAEPLDRARALDDDARARGARHAGHERDRRGEDQRARRGDDEHRERADGIAADQPMHAAAISDA